MFPQFLDINYILFFLVVEPPFQVIWKDKHVMLSSFLNVKIELLESNTKIHTCYLSSFSLPEGSLLLSKSEN